MERNREKKQVLYKFSKYSLFLFIKLKFKSHGKKNSIMSRRSNLVELDIWIIINFPLLSLILTYKKSQLFFHGKAKQ